MVLGGKKIVLGITGGIAAYKTTFLVRLLVKAGAHVKVLMSPSAVDFVSPLTLATLSKNPVVTSFIKEEDNTTSWNNHVSLGLWADLMLVAPATANTLSKMAHGTCDNLLLAVYLSAKCPVYFAPAMDLDMYKHPSTKQNFDTLSSFGNIMIPAESGELASGLEGEGRMAEPENIVQFISDHISNQLPLRGKRILITAGPTYEAIDPVRFIGNHSSGLMGFELAHQAAAMGAQVTLVSGPSKYESQHANVVLHRVVSAQEMFDKTTAFYDDTDIAICAAAVADYRPENPASHKIKKNSDSLQIDLVKNPDILKTLGERKTNQFLVGFALETQNEEANAKGKLERKHLDAIVLNSMQDPGAGFGTPTNKIKFIDKNLTITAFELKTKADVALDILNEIIKRIYAS
jgi:phosphopantothenoylcysteine decarboxylase/phosphopantothenate--cysteine ligase